MQMPRRFNTYCPHCKAHEEHEVEKVRSGRQTGMKWAARQEKRGESTIGEVLDTDDGAKRLRFNADSDSAIVKGLFAILRALFSDRTPDEILAVDLDQAFERIGLDRHLSPNRRNGFYSMIEEMRRSAAVVKSMG